MANVHRYLLGSMAKIRALVTRLNLDTIERCQDLALRGERNSCFQASRSEDVINVLAKAGFVSQLIQKGMSLPVAMRELGKRMRVVQGESK